MWVTLKTTHKLLILNLGITDYLEATTVCKQVVYRLKGQCVSMEAVEFRWFHWQWNHNETKGLPGFTVHAVDSRHHMCSTWKTTKEHRRMEQWKQMYLCFNETFVKWRKLRVDLSESVWYVVEQYSERTRDAAIVVTYDMSWHKIPWYDMT